MQNNTPEILYRLTALASVPAAATDAAPAAGSTLAALVLEVVNSCEVVFTLKTWQACDFSDTDRIKPLYTIVADSTLLIMDVSVQQALAALLSDMGIGDVGADTERPAVVSLPDMADRSSHDMSTLVVQQVLQRQAARALNGEITGSTMHTTYRAAQAAIVVMLRYLTQHANSNDTAVPRQLRSHILLAMDAWLFQQDRQGHGLSQVFHEFLATWFLFQQLAKPA